VLLITGASGTLGREFARLVPEALTPSHSDLDLTRRDTVFDYVTSNQVETAIHCAALASVSTCETNQRQAYQTNVKGTRNILDALSRHKPDGYFVYVSTACVFPGDEPTRFYSEEDIPYPKNFYGMTKLLAEHSVVERASTSDLKALIIRTNFAGRGKWKHPSAFVDRYGTYLYPDQVARAVTDLMRAKMKGHIHVSGDRRISMYDFARIEDPNVKPMTLNNYRGPPVTVNMCLTSKRVPLVPFEPKVA